MNPQELANHFERILLVPEERASDEWDFGWNAAIETVIRIMRAQETID